MVGCGSNDVDGNSETALESAPGGRAGDHDAAAGIQIKGVRGSSVEGHPQPSTPAVNVVRRERSVVIHFSFPERRAGEAEPWLLLTSVNSAGTKVPPLTKRTSVAGKRVGEITQPLGAGSPPFKLLVATLSRIGLRSRVVEVPLKE